MVALSVYKYIWVANMTYTYVHRVFLRNPSQSSIVGTSFILWVWVHFWCDELLISIFFLTRSYPFGKRVFWARKFIFCDRACRYCCLSPITFPHVRWTHSSSLTHSPCSRRGAISLLMDDVKSCTRIHIYEGGNLAWVEILRVHEVKTFTFGVAEATSCPTLTCCMCAQIYGQGQYCTFCFFRKWILYVCNVL